MGSRRRRRGGSGRSGSRRGRSGLRRGRPGIGGGAILNGSAMTITNSTVSGNTSTTGGGIFIVGGQAPRPPESARLTELAARLGWPIMGYTLFPDYQVNARLSLVSPFYGSFFLTLGIEVVEGIPIPGYDRFEFRDPFGNRVEFMERR